MLRLWIVFIESLNSGAVAVRRFMYVRACRFLSGPYILTYIEPSRCCAAVAF